VGGGLDGNIDPAGCIHNFLDLLTVLSAVVVIKILQIRSKSLISKSFGSHPEKLWITLWRTWVGWPQTLENQAFR
jgi:hypothetical protein